MAAYHRFYSLPSQVRRFPVRGARSRFYWTIYNLCFRKGELTGRNIAEVIAQPTDPPRHPAEPPLLPQRAEWRDLVQGSEY